MFYLRNLAVNWLKHWLRIGASILIPIFMSLGFSAVSWADVTPILLAGLPAGNAITDGRSLLNYALPINNPTIRKIQTSLENMSLPLRNRRWGVLNGTASKVVTILRVRKPELLASIPNTRKAQAETLLAAAEESMTGLQAAIAAQDKEKVESVRADLLNFVGDIEALMVDKFPFEIPEEYSNLPQLTGRATIVIVTDKGKITLVADGYSAPITAGNFVDLVQRGFYNGLEFTRTEDYYVAQAGDPPGPEVGFIDPTTQQARTIPLEILVKGDSEPIYNFTLEEIGRYREQPVLPFSAYGTVGMARPEAEPDGGSSQFFFFLYEAELTPAGVNLLDGRYAAFGYVIEGKEVLGKLKAGDKIQSAKIISGGENLIQPS